MTKTEKARSDYQKNKKRVQFQMVAMSLVLGKPLSTQHVDDFFMRPEDMKMKGADYYAIAVQVAKALCSVAKVVCPYVEDLP